MTYIFDFDGTLVDSMPIYANRVEAVLAENNIPCPDNIVNILTPLGYAGAARYVIGLGLDITVEEFLKEANACYLEEYTYRVPVKPYVREKLLSLKAQGHSINVLTASPHAMMDVCLKRLKLYDLFDHVWSSDDFEYTKSDPQIYMEAAKRLGTTVEHCCFVDDNLGAVTAAKASGIYTVGIYDPSSEYVMNEIKAIADRYIYDFREL